jgi:putative ABC transport system permease protein
VGTNFFSTLGVKPIIGRAFLASEEEHGNDHVLVLSGQFWQRRFASDPAIVGHSIAIDGEKYTIIGVMPLNFRFPIGGEDYWTPLAMNPEERNSRQARSLTVVARLHAGANLDAARAETGTAWSRLQREYPQSNRGYSMLAIRLQDHIINEDSRPFVWLLTGVAGFVLLIACANVANLQLARATSRRAEIAMRVALGAKRGRIIRQLLTESVVLSLAGALLGLAAAAWALKALVLTMPSELAAIGDPEGLHLDAATLLFAMCVAVAAGILSGLAPAWHLSRPDVNDALKNGARSTGGRRGGRWHSVFVVSEVTLSLVLLTGAHLMVKGSRTLANGSEEIKPSGLLTFHVNLPASEYGDLYKARAFYRNALERILGIRGVESAAAASGLPYTFYDDEVSVRTEAQSAVPAEQLPLAMRVSVTLAYFRALRLPILAGRPFDAHDVAGTSPVAVVSDSMARRLWPGASAIGKRVQIAGAQTSQPLTVIGVAGDTRHEVYDRSPRSVLYLPFEQAPPQAADFAVRVREDPGQIVPEVRSAIYLVDKNRAVERPESMEEKIRTQASSLRYIGSLMSVFAAVAVVLAALGIYGVMSYSVRERRREIGIRMALGARPGRVLGMALVRGMTLAGAGMAVGLPAALALARLLSDLFYGVGSWDPATFAIAPAGLAAIAFAATYVPARSAMKLDPVDVLREQ